MLQEPLLAPKDGSLSSRSSTRPTEASDTGGSIDKEELPSHIRILFENLEDLLWSLVLVAAVTYGMGTFCLVGLRIDFFYVNYNLSPFALLFFMGLLWCLVKLSQVITSAFRLHKEYEPMRTQIRVLMPRGSWHCGDIYCGALSCSWRGMWDDMKDLGATLSCCDAISLHARGENGEKEGHEDTSKILEDSSVVNSPGPEAEEDEVDEVNV